MRDAPATHGAALGALAPSLGDTCRDYLQTYTQSLEDAVRGGEGGLAVAKRRAEVLDGLLNSLFCAADAAVRATGEGPSGRVALVACGSYGRNTLSLQSDVDVIFLADQPDDPKLVALAEAFLYPVWDVGMKMGHAVRGLDETLALSREDISTATTLLDMRRIAGDAEIVTELAERGKEALFQDGLEGFLKALRDDTRDRHERFGGSLYLLEPEVKLGRGGLRDLDVGIWGARAACGARDADGLVEKGMLLPRELEAMAAAQEMQFRVRNLLHLRSRRAQDRLTFEDQEEIAVQMGYEDGVTLGVEQFMQAYYRHARNVASLSERLLHRATPARSVQAPAIDGLPAGIITRDAELDFENAAEQLEQDPAQALVLMHEVVRHQRPPSQEARDAVMNAADDPDWGLALRRQSSSARAFNELLTHAGDVPCLRRGSLLGELHEQGMLLSVIPEFEPVTGRAQHDIYHVYTVDVHSIAAIDRLRTLMRGDLAGKLPLASRLAAETVRPLPLYLGLLLHDIGKAHGKDHARQGAIMARPIAERLALSPLDVDHVVWLVQEHLSLYHWATRRDITDPETIDEVARNVGSLDRLRDLYLLTVCDLATTNPKALTDWKARMLEDLYLAVASTLEGRMPDLRARAEEIRSQVRVGFVGDAVQDALEAFVDEMPERYLLAFPVDVIRAHARAAAARGDAQVHVATLPGPSKDVSELLVLTDDRPGLLADAAAVLAAENIAITHAQVFSRKRKDHPDEAFDLLHVRRSDRKATGFSREELSSIASDIRDIVSGDITVEELLKRRSEPPAWAVRKAPDVATKVVIDNSASPRFTVVDVYTKDHVGLLQSIARVLSEEGLSIVVAKVNTEGLKAADVFYVERPGGGKLSDPERAEGLRQKLLATLEAQS